MKADLHLHSTASDGTLTPGELVRAAQGAGMTLMAITDHDSVGGVPEAEEVAESCGMQLIPGVELSCGAGREVHVLGYGVDIRHEGLLAFCARRRQERNDRALRMVSQLQEAGCSISFDVVHEMARGVIGRPHVARALVEAGYASSVQDAFTKYLVPGKCGYVPKPEVRVTDGIRLIHEAGGLAVLAHPMQLKMSDTALISVMEEWVSSGLDGVEIYHPSTGNQHVALLQRIAAENRLLITSGSDFHGPGVKDVSIGQEWPRWQNGEEDAGRLLDRLCRMHEKL